MEYSINVNYVDWYCFKIYFFAISSLSVVEERLLKIFWLIFAYMFSVLLFYVYTCKIAVSSLWIYAFMFIHYFTLSDNFFLCILLFMIV